MMMSLRRSRSFSVHCWLCVALGLILAVTIQGVAEVQGQDAPAQGDLAGRWAAIQARREAVLADVESIKTAFPTASPDEKIALREKFESLATQYEEQVLPELKSLAPQVFAADPKNVEAGQVAMSIAFEENRYKDSAGYAQQLLAAGDESPVVKNMLGVSLFATHEFEKARTVLLAAEQAGELIPQLGGRYLDGAGEYAELWKTEKALREAEAQAPPAEQLPQAMFRTTKGDIVIQLFEDQAPNTVANFVSLIENKKYDGTAFHRVIPQFMAQGGDPNSLDQDPSNDGTGGPGYTIACECYRPDARMHFQGSLSMAHAGKDSGGSQFFITHLPTAHLNPDPQRQSGHTVFGRVIKGMEVAATLQKGDRIVEAVMLSKRNHPYVPKTNPE